MTQLSLPPGTAPPQVVRVNVMQIRINVAATIQQMFLSGQIRREHLPQGEEWKGGGQQPPAVPAKIARLAVAHADALIDALGFRRSNDEMEAG